MELNRGLFAASALLVLAALASAHQETEIAIAELTALIAKAPHQPSLWFSRSQHYREHERWDEAEADLAEAERLRPDLPDLNLAFARLYTEAGRSADALRRVELALRGDPRDPTALILRARLRTRSGQSEAAERDFSAAIALLPEPRPEIFLERAALPQPSDRALAGLEEGIARVGPALALMERALTLELQLGRTDAALRRLSELASFSERKEFWLKRRGDILAAAGRDGEARQAYQDALKALQALPEWLRDAPDVARLAKELAALIARKTPSS